MDRELEYRRGVFYGTMILIFMGIFTTYISYLFDIISSDFVGLYALAMIVPLFASASEYFYYKHRLLQQMKGGQKLK